MKDLTLSQEEYRKQQLDNVRFSDKQKTTIFREKIKSLQNIDAQIKKNIPINAWEAITLSREHRKALKEGHFYVFFFAFALAFSKDGFLDLIGSVPILGQILVLIPSLAVTIYLFFFLWGRGTWIIRLIRIILLIMDWFPIISLIPINIFCVAWAYYQAKKEYRKALFTEKKSENILK
ncbi:MAG: hypothetical protein EOM19_01545 [Candidatus Moranbacteria bacterium]|nr:hypothetical protein [Candidatus Moranbacteria bacterium]